MNYITEIEEKLKSITYLSYDDVQKIFNSMVRFFKSLFSARYPCLRTIPSEGGVLFFKFDCEDYLVFLIENGFRFYKDCIFSSQIFKELEGLFADIDAENFTKDLYVFLVEAILVTNSEIEEIEKYTETIVNKNKQNFFEKIIFSLKKLEELKKVRTNEKV